MDALLASAGPMKPAKKRRTGPPPRERDESHKTIQRGDEKIDPSLHSILPNTRLPDTFHSRSLPTGSAEAVIKPDKAVGRIADKKLRARVARTDVASKRAKRERDDVNEWLNAPLAGDIGGIEVDEEAGERTWRVKQQEIVKEVGVASGRKKFDLRFEDMGSYKLDYTRNGRQIRRLGTARRERMEEERKLQHSGTMVGSCLPRPAKEAHHDIHLPVSCGPLAGGVTDRDLAKALHIAIASSKGHVATFDWQAGRLLSEIQLRESVRDIKFLQSESFYAVAQKKYVFIYDKDGTELHKLKQHMDPTHLEYLPYHYLLSSVGHAGHLKYHDVSTGTMLTQIPTHFGSPSSMTQNAHSAIIHLGHANGTMTMWSPNLTTPHVRLLAHRGPVTAMAVDPSERSAGRYCATAGLDGTVKIWDGRMWGKEVQSFRTRNAPTSMTYSGRGMLAVGSKSGVSVYRDLLAEGASTTPYLTLPLPSLTADTIKFCPFDDVLGVGHSKGLSSLLVPGSGEANFDSAEADVFESHTRRREREVRSVMEKIRPELITMDTNYLGTVREEKPDTFEAREARSYRQLGRMERLRQAGEDVDGENADSYGAAGAKVADAESDEEDTRTGAGTGKPEKKRKKMRGKGGSTSRYLAKKQKKNIVDSSLLAMRDKVAAQNRAAEEKRKVDAGEVIKESGALARFG